MRPPTPAARPGDLGDGPIDGAQEPGFIGAIVRVGREELEEAVGLVGGQAGGAPRWG